MWSHFSHVQLWATLWTVAHQAPLSMRLSRQKYWSGLPFPSSRGSSWSRNWTHCVQWRNWTSVLAGRFFTTSAIWEAPLEKWCPPQALCDARCRAPVITISLSISLIKHWYFSSLLLKPSKVLALSLCWGHLFLASSPCSPNPKPQNLLFSIFFLCVEPSHLLAVEAVPGRVDTPPRSSASLGQNQFWWPSLSS